MAVPQGIPLCCPVSSRAYSHRTETSGEWVFIGLSLSQWSIQSFCSRSLLAYNLGCSLRGRVLIKCTFKGWLSSSLETLEVDAVYMLSFCQAPGCQYCMEGSLYMCLVSQFLCVVLAFVAKAHGISLDYLWVLFPGFHMTVTIRYSSLPTTILRAKHG